MGAVWVVHVQYLDFPDAPMELRLCTSHEGKEQSIRYWTSRKHRTRVTVYRFDEPSYWEDHYSHVS